MAEFIKALAEFIKVLQDFRTPTLLILAGIIFLLLAIGVRLKIIISDKVNKKLAGIIGSILLLIGIILAMLGPTEPPPLNCNSAKITSHGNTRGNPTSPDNLPHFSRTVKISWSPSCPMTIHAYQDGNLKYKYESVSPDTVNMLLEKVPAGWTEIAIWMPNTTIKVDSVHVVLCDPPAAQCN